MALLIIFFGPSSFSIMTFAFVLYGIGLSGLLTSLGGLFAVDITPRDAAGAAMGFIGVFSYLGAAIQEQVSASLISTTVAVTTNAMTYKFDSAILYWVETSIVSAIIAASLWQVKPKE